jgi:hypothetical protein
MRAFTERFQYDFRASALADLEVALARLADDNEVGLDARADFPRGNAFEALLMHDSRDGDGSAEMTLGLFVIIRGGGGHARQRALHVACAAAKELFSFQSSRKWRVCPQLRVDDGTVSKCPSKRIVFPSRLPRRSMMTLPRRSM